MSEENKNQPIASTQFDRVQAAIWRQEVESGKEPFNTLTISRSYKGDDGEWRRVSSFTVRDIPHLALAVEWAMHELLLKPQ
jgi:hypothetical protein